ncbi:MAG: phosphate ABC transporter, permease protein PstA [Elusimicrobia bacterium CG11_big_fil_rev_8_21_14_0_20_64_6]|nr:MAG: phosphate ABC transporter, permease protein PstA [Elusimicrobia bacterium CG11_big_fil_rev_8_21_14_0_20_64_6]
MIKAPPRIVPPRSRRGDGASDAVVAWSGAALVTGTVAWMLADIISHGTGALSWSFLSQSPSDAGRAGGIAPILVSTAAILAVCLAACVPLGLGTAILLSEYAPADERLGRAVRRSLDVLAGTPSILFGLFGNAFFCKTLGLGFSILSGGLTLACMALPILIRTVEEGLRAVPAEQRLSAAALGLSRAGTLVHVLLPAAAPSLAAGLILGIGRALAETAALVFTSGYVDRFPASPFDSGRALSVHVYELAMNVPGGDANAYGSALVLVLLLLALNLSVVRLSGSRRYGRSTLR